MESLLPTIANQYGMVAAVAIVLNIIMLGAFVGLGKWFANHVLSELKAIRSLLSTQAEDATKLFSAHGERIAKLEARIDDFNRFR